MSQQYGAPPAYEPVKNYQQGKGKAAYYEEASEEPAKYGAPSYQSGSGNSSSGGGGSGRNQKNRGGDGDDNYHAGEEQRFDFATSEYRDFPFAVAFIAHLVVFAVAAVVCGRQFAAEGGFNRIYDETSVTAYSVALFVLITAISSALLSFVYLNFMRNHIDNVMAVSFYVFMTFLTGFGLVSVYLARSPMVAIITAVCLAISIFYYWSIRDRLELAGAMLRSASLALVAYPGPIYIAFSCMLVQFAWALAWCMGALFILSSIGMLTIGGIDADLHDAKNVDVSHALIVIGLILSLYWTSQVIKNVSHVTTAGTVASWWLVPGRMGESCLGSLKRACTTSLGSICFGSLIVAVLQTLQAILRFFRKDDERNFVQYCIDCLLSCIERAVQFFNHFAYTYVAIYGDTFSEASQKAWSLFYHRGFFVIINNDLTHIPLFMGKLLIAVALGVVTYGYTALVPALPTGQCVGFAFAAGLISIFIVSVVFGVITSAVSTTLVLWAESPMEMESTQPVAFKSIADAGKHECGYDSHDNDA